MGYGDWWYKASFAFVAGIFWSYKYNEINEYFKDKYFMKIAIVFSLLIVTYFAYLTNIKFMTYAGNMLAAVLFVTFSATILMKIKIGNRFINKIGNISYEMYLFRGLIINTLLKEMIPVENSVLNISLTLVILIIMSLIFRNTYNKLSFFLPKRKKAFSSQHK